SVIVPAGQVTIETTVSCLKTPPGAPSYLPLAPLAYASTESLLLMSVFSLRCRRSASRIAQVGLRAMTFCNMHRRPFAAWAVLLVAAVACPAMAVAAEGTAPQAGKVDPEADYSDELPRIEANSPEQSHKLLHALPGFEIQLAACEPQVVDPIACSFDERGRLYVICMRDYSEQEHDQLGEVRLLEDA